MRIIKILLLLIICQIFHAGLIAQSKSDIAAVQNLFEPHKQTTEYLQFATDNTNEIEWMASGLFLIYKWLLSSQDLNRCVFQPSCSVYTIQSIKKNGIFKGFMDGMDRLSRCNRLSAEKYIPYENTKLLYDPVW